MKKCIVFDIDRTIVDSYMSELLSLQKAIENVTNKKINEKEMKKLTSLTTADFFKFLNVSEKEISLINKEWETTFTTYETMCFPKIKEVIKKLYDNGYILGIITSRTKDEFRELDNVLFDILDCFTIVITADLINNPKPNTDSIDYLCNKLQLTTKDIVYIGDSEVDKVFSKNCKIDFIPACWENKELENEFNACASIDNLFDRIEKIGG